MSKIKLATLPKPISLSVQSIIILPNIVAQNPIHNLCSSVFCAVVPTEGAEMPPYPRSSLVAMPPIPSGTLNGDFLAGNAKISTSDVRSSDWPKRRIHDPSPSISVHLWKSPNWLRRRPHRSVGAQLEEPALMVIHGHGESFSAVEKNKFYIQ